MHVQNLLEQLPSPDALPCAGPVLPTFNAVLNDKERKIALDLLELLELLGESLRMRFLIVPWRSASTGV